MTAAAATTTAARVRIKSKWSVLASAVAKNSGSKRSKLTDGDEGVDEQPPPFPTMFRFPPYGLFKSEPVIEEADGAENFQGDWFRVSLLRHEFPGLVPKTEASVKVRSPPCPLTPRDLIGFNNTGNVGVWPSEECLTIYALEQPEIFRGKNVVELGAGMSGLAGLFIGLACKPAHVVLTDGNDRSVDNIDNILQANGLRDGDRNLKTRFSSLVLRWGEEPLPEAMEGAFDVAVCSDCLFFDDSRALLLQCLKRVLRQDGPVCRALVVAPERRGTLRDFVAMAKRDLFFTSVQVHSQYSTIVDEVRSDLERGADGRFDADVHYPVLVSLERRMVPRSSLHPAEA